MVTPTRAPRSPKGSNKFVNVVGMTQRVCILVLAAYACCLTFVVLVDRNKIETTTTTTTTSHEASSTNVPQYKKTESLAFVLSSLEQGPSFDASLVSNENRLLNRKEQEPQMHKPMRQLKKYKSQHGVQALKREVDACKKNGECAALEARRFATAYYACPHQAGNRLHHFMNGLMWGIATNRTVLYHYFTMDFCKAHGENMGCAAANDPEECRPILQMASWIPSFEEWKDVLGIKDVYHVSHWSTHMPPGNPDPRPESVQERFPFTRKESEQKRGMDVKLRDKMVLNFGIMVDKDAGRVFQDANARKYLLESKDSRLAASNLCALGRMFTYGMLFYDVFVLSDRVKPPAALMERISKKKVVFALHSRHPEQEDDGSDTTREEKCLDRMLKKKDCAVLIMSDRPATVEKVTKLVKERTCTPFAREKESKSDAGLAGTEHGPFAGVGFFEDLLFATSAPVNGFIGHQQRSSSSLIQALLIYNRFKDGEYEDNRQEAAKRDNGLTVPKCTYV